MTGDKPNTEGLRTTETESWTYAPSLSDAPSHTIYGPRGEVFATVYRNKDRARLVAAAPALLAVAKQYASECSDCGGTGRIVTRSGGSGWGDGGPDVHEEVEHCSECEDIRAVIAKAEARS